MVDVEMKGSELDGLMAANDLAIGHAGVGATVCGPHVRGGNCVSRVTTRAHAMCKDVETTRFTDMGEVHHGRFS